MDQATAINQETQAPQTQALQTQATQTEAPQMALKATAAALKRIASNVEVERKFNPGPKFFSLFNNNTPNLQEPPFTLSKHPSQLIRDTYYDTADGRLEKMGVWVRQRSINPLSLNSTASINATADRAGSEWNAKVRIGGHYSNSQFIEYDGLSDVSREVICASEEKIKLEDLSVASDLNTRRSEWEVTHMGEGKIPPAKLTIVVDDVIEAKPKAVEDGTDKATFNHVVGEVEFFQEFVTEDKDEADHKALSKEVGAQRMNELEEFMLCYPELFSVDPKPIGKLSAYETWRAKHN